MDPLDLTKLPIAEMLSHQVHAHGGEVFLKFRNSEFTYAEVDAMANRFARGLAAAGVRAGDHVSVMLPNSADFVHVVLALAKLAVVVVPVNTMNRGESLRHVLDNSDSSALVVDAEYLDRLAPLLPSLPGLVQIVVRGIDRAAVEGTLPSARPQLLADLLSFGDESVCVAAKASDIHAIMYTSGTSGPAKGVLVPHLLALANASDVRKFTNCEEKTIYCPLPLFHAAALWDGLFSTILAGAQIAVVERFSASRFWDDVRVFDAGVALGVPSMIPILLAAEPTERDKDHPLETLYMGKSALDESFYGRFGVHSVETYTSTEIGVGTGSPYGKWRAGSCGRANDRRFDVEVVDEADNFVGLAQVGELVARPTQQNVMAAGYYGAAEATAQAFRNHWFHTGDRVWRDENGYFYFVDRMTDSIRRRGENISAFDIECAVNLHPSIVECAAIAVPSELEEDEVKLVAVLALDAVTTPAELLAFCDARLPKFAVPRFVEFVEALPKTANGKVAKYHLRSIGEAGITAGTWDRTNDKRDFGATE